MTMIPNRSSSQPGHVYLVVGSDTAIWNAVTTVDVYTRHPHYSQSSFTLTNAPIFQIMDPAWRAQYRDSYQQPIKLTWWMMCGNIYRDADNLNVPTPNLMTLYLMKKYHGDPIRQYGDELSLHYHTFYWSDYNLDGIYHWNQSRTFDECREDWDVTLAQFLLEGGLFPASFRSGWHFMDADWQAYLNELIPFCFHDDYGVFRAWSTNEPIAGVEDWSRAPSTFVPFHPSTNDYQTPGESLGWNVRSVKMQNLTQADLNYIFSQASNGVDQVACLWSHLPENFVSMIGKTAALVSEASATYPGVPFRYCTAAEAMQRWQGITNPVPLQLAVQESVQDQVTTLTITTERAIFQPKPFVCMRDVFRRYTNLTPLCNLAGTNSWTVQLPIPRTNIAKVGIAVTDPLGNVATQVLRYVPEDVYLDNLDPEYSETEGAWTTTTNASWGINARIAPLASNDVAQVRWFLPILTSGPFNLCVQIPALTNACTNVSFTLFSAGSNTWSRTLATGLHTNQWNFIGQLVLNASESNFLDMTFTGSNQPGARAVADVLAIVPFVSTGDVPMQNQLSIKPTSKGLLLQFSGEPGTQCGIQRTADLSGGWTTLDVLSVPVTGILEFEDKSITTGAAFYRIEEISPPL